MKYWLFNLGTSDFYITQADSLTTAKSNASRYFGDSTSFGEPKQVSQDELSQYIGGSSVRSSTTA